MDCWVVFGMESRENSHHMSWEGKSVTNGRELSNTNDGAEENHPEWVVRVIATRVWRPSVDVP